MQKCSSSTDKENDSKCYCYNMLYVIQLSLLYYMLLFYDIFFQTIKSSSLYVICIQVQCKIKQWNEFCRGSLSAQLNIKWNMKKKKNHNRNKMRENPLRKTAIKTYRSHFSLLSFWTAVPESFMTYNRGLRRQPCGVPLVRTDCSSTVSCLE